MVVGRRRELVGERRKEKGRELVGERSMIFKLHAFVGMSLEGLVPVFC